MGTAVSLHCFYKIRVLLEINFDMLNISKFTHVNTTRCVVNKLNEKIVMRYTSKFIHVNTTTLLRPRAVL